MNSNKQNAALVMIYVDFGSYEPAYWFYSVAAIVGIFMILSIKQTQNPDEYSELLEKLGI